MDLSGKLIKGTGSYEVKEIAPSIQDGQILLNNAFDNWTADDPDDWSIYGTENATNYVTEVSGKCKIVSDGDQMGIRQSGITIGRTYTLLVNVTEMLVPSLAIYGSGLYGIITTSGLYSITFVADFTWIYIIRSGTCNAVIDWITLEEVSEGYPLMDKGAKYLECTSSGTLAIPSKQAYGEWEFDLYKKGSPQIFFIQDSITSGSAQGYNILLNTNEGIQLQRKGVANDFVTANDYIVDNTWYRIKVTRTLNGEFYVYIRGGGFGDNDWTLIDVSGGTGTNPIIQNTYITSKYFVVDLDIGDCIANLTMRNIVKQ